MQKMDPFCKDILKWLSNGKAPKHEANLFLHVKALGSCDPQGMEVHSISGST